MTEMCLYKNAEIENSSLEKHSKTTVFLVVKIFEHLDKHSIIIVRIIGLADTFIKRNKPCCRIKIKQFWLVITFYVNGFSAYEVFHF